ncbi:hypothetical protein HKX48_004503 [Thoreauomyces humboldtii]|nr:hypothetical protein HKX48_004503 [Thoreauomyces humboldtii]
MAFNLGLTYPRLNGPLYAIPLALGVALMGAGFRYTFDQAGTATTFGVAASASRSAQRGLAAGDVYMTVAGIRNFTLGATIALCAGLRDRRSTGLVILGAVLVPLLDGVVAFRHAANPWATALLHWVPATGAGVLAYALLFV